MNDYKFTETWFDGNIPNWTNLFTALKEQLDFVPKSVLEIGCFEGRATTWLCDNILQEGTRYDIVDTFGGSLNETGMGEAGEKLKEEDFIYNNFRHNISFHDKINFTIHRGESQKILPTFDLTPTYDFIYIDASHRADDTFVDAYYANKLLKNTGLMIFDDFGWKDPKDNHPSISPELGVHTFIANYDREYKLVMKGYQVAVWKK